MDDDDVMPLLREAAVLAGIGIGWFKTLDDAANSWRENRRFTPGPAAAGGDSEAAGWATIRYTLDGTTPTPASPAYVPGSPINLDTAAAGTATVHIRAVAFDANNTLLGAVRDTTWLRQ